GNGHGQGRGRRRGRVRVRVRLRLRVRWGDMGLQSRIQENSRRVSDATAGTRDYFELATTNLSLYRALRAAAEQYARGRLLDAGAGRMAYRRMLEEFCGAYESLDLSGPAAGRLDHVADLQATGLPD